MPDIIIDYPGEDFVMIDGVCYQFVEFLPEATVEDLTVQGTYNSCSNCLSPESSSLSSSSSSEVVPFAAACSGCGGSGDVHWVFGNETAISAGISNASFNVDDNAGLNEIVWFTFTEGATEYVIKYTQQEFAFTLGGKSISEIVITETGQSDIVYSLTANQDGVLKDGGAFLEPDTFVIGNNVAQVSISSRTIDSSSRCCLRPDEYFSLLNLDVHFKDGLYYTDEVGGALYYIWKKASTLGAGPINTLSEAGIDGLGDFLAGLDGYSSRSDFEATPSTLREATNISTMASIANKMTALSTISGNWDADWDPLAEEPYECPIGSCGTPNADPTVFVTVVWTDLDATKNYLGCSWCNGETKEVYATNYTLLTGSLTQEERWDRNVGSFGNRLDIQKLSNKFTSFPSSTYINVGIVALTATNGVAGLNVRNRQYNNNGTSSNTLNVLSQNINKANLILGDYRIHEDMFGSVTSTAGVTITWARGNDW